MSAIRLLAAAAFAAAAIFAQSGAARPEFEVASIKPSPPQMPNQAAIGIHIDGAQVRANYLPLKDYLRMAYDVKDDGQIVGPDWIATDRFEIAAKVPEGRHGKIREMMQALLEDRFRMKVHRETREFPVYALTVAKGGLKIQPLEPDPNDPPEGAGPVDVTAGGGPTGVFVNFGHGRMFQLADNKFQIKKLTLTEFADSLSRFADRQVVDMTGAPGRYDFSIDMTPEDYRGMLIRSAIKAGVTLPAEAMRMLEGVSGESFFRSLQAAGLKADSRKAPLEVVVIDKISKTSTEN